MAVPIVSLITRRSAGHRPSFRRQRGFRVAPQHALLVIAAGSVALWLLRSRQRRAASSALPPPGTVFRPVIHRADADDEDAICFAARSADERQGGPAIVATTVWSIPAYSTSLPLPWVHRAEIAVRLGRADELRGVAVEMQRAGQDIEAGLLENYALLLERSRSGRERILAEVTRMLRAATEHRRSAPPEPTAADHAERIDSTGAPPARAPFIPPPPVPRAAARVEPRDVSTDASKARPVIPMPVLAIGEKRRASR